MRGKQMAKSPEEMRKNMTEQLREKTGKSFPEWQKLIRTQEFSRHGEIMKFLKEEHGVTHGYANQIALEALRPTDAPAPGSDDLVTAQYAAKKAALKPIYEKLVALLRRIDSSVEFAPKKAYVSVRRAKQFAIIQPTTATRLDIGINLKGYAPTTRLESSGSFNAMVSHRVRISHVGEIDSELESWLRKACGAAG
jgi:predicted transport protein